MNSAHLSAVSLTIIIYSLIAVASLGWGRVAVKWVDFNPNAG